MADDAVVLVIVISLVMSIVLLGILGFLGMLAMRRRRLKDHVWVSVDLDTGETKWFLSKPDRTEKGTPLRTKYGMRMRVWARETGVGSREPE